MVTVVTESLSGQLIRAESQSTAGGQTQVSNLKNKFADITLTFRCKRVLTCFNQIRFFFFHLTVCLELN